MEIETSLTMKMLLIAVAFFHRVNGRRLFSYKNEDGRLLFVVNDLFSELFKIGLSLI